MYSYFALMLLGLLLLLIRGLFAKSLELKLAYFFCWTLVLLGGLGPIVWETIRGNLPAGYLGFISLLPEDVFNLHVVLLSMALGIFAGAIPLVIAKNFNQSISNSSTSFTFLFRGTKTNIKSSYLVILGATTVVMRLIGEGTSILFRDFYLQTNGINFFLRSSNVIILPISMLMLYAANKNLDKKFNKYLLSTVATLLILTLARGSRSGLIIIIGLFFYFYLKMKLNLIGKITLILTSSYLLLVTMNYISIARSSSHGILLLPKNFFRAFDIGLLPSQNTFETLIGSALNWIVVLPRSIGTLDLNGLIANADPTIGKPLSILSISTSGYELLFPYTWVPLSTAGQMYGVVGAVGIFACFSILTFVNLTLGGRGLASKNNSGQIVGFLMLSTFALQFIFFLQYSSGVWFRMIHVLFVLNLISIFVGKTDRPAINKLANREANQS
jgi:hypothetical protein